MYNSGKEFVGLFIIICIIVVGLGFLKTCTSNSISEDRKHCEDTRPPYHLVTGDLVIFNRTGEEVRVSNTSGWDTDRSTRCGGQTRKIKVTFKDGVSSGWIDLGSITIKE